MKKNNEIKSIIKKYKGSFFCLFLLSFVASFANVVSPLLIGNMIDTIMQAEIKNFLFFLLILAILYLLLFISNFLLNAITSRFVARLTKDIRNKLIQKIHKLPLSYLDRKEKGDIVNHFSVDVENIGVAFTSSLSRITTGIATVFLTLFFMLHLNIPMAIFVMLCAPFMYFLSRFVTKKTVNTFETRANLVGAFNGFAEEVFSSPALIQNFSYEENAKKELERRNQELYKTGVKAQFYSSLTNPSTRLISNLSYVLVGLLGLSFYQTHMISIGEISTFLLFTNLFTRPFQEVTSVMGEIQTGLSSLKRISSFLQEKEEKKEKKSCPLLKVEGDIEFKHVFFGYTKKSPVIQDLSLPIAKGKTVAIVGETGSGKTTLVNLLMRFYTPQSGSILIDGMNIQDMPKEFLHTQIGMVLQDTKLFSGTIKENIAYGKPDATTDEIVQAAKLANAHTFISRLPNGYDTEIKENSSLSSGEIQLLTLARILLLHPPIVILDEATSNIDLVTENKVQKAIREVTKHATTLMIAHRLSTIQRADAICFLENGTIQEMGTHEELLRKNGAYAKLYNSQFYEKNKS